MSLANPKTAVTEERLADFYTAIKPYLGATEVDSALSPTSTNPVQNKVVKANLDSWTQAATAATVGSDVVVEFDNLSDNYGYSLYGVDEDVTYTSVTESTGTITGTIKLTYVLDGATTGVTQCRLRILK